MTPQQPGESKSKEWKCKNILGHFWPYLQRLTFYILFDYRKDARLPVQLQRAMAAEAEAAREARAKVTKLTLKKHQECTVDYLSFRYAQVK